MKFTQYASAAEFSGEVTDILMKQEIQNNLFFLNIRSGIASADNSNMLMATVKDDEGVVLLTALRTKPFPMLLYETDNIPCDDALEFFTASLVENNIDIDVIMTEKKLAKKFSNSYGRRIGKRFNNNENLVLYVLESIMHITALDGTFRKANDDDMFYLPYWMADFVPACHLGDYNLNSGVMNTIRMVDDEKLYIWEDKHPVAAAACVRKTSNCGFVGQVYTPPHFRGRGYSTACVSSLSQQLFDDGFKYCALYADCANPYSNRVYQKIGYKEFFYYDKYTLT